MSSLHKRSCLRRYDCKEVKVQKNRIDIEDGQPNLGTSQYAFQKQLDDFLPNAARIFPGQRPTCYLPRMLKSKTIKPAECSSSVKNLEWFGASDRKKAVRIPNNIVKTFGLGFSIAVSLFHVYLSPFGLVADIFRQLCGEWSKLICSRYFHLRR